MANRDALEKSLYFIYTNLKLDKTTCKYISGLAYSFNEQYAVAIEKLILDIIYASRYGGNTVGAIINLTIFILDNVRLNQYSTQYLNIFLTRLNSPSGNYIFTERMKLLPGLLGISILICNNCWYSKEKVSVTWKNTKKGKLTCIHCGEKEDFVECAECDEPLFRLSKKNNLKCEDCGEKFDKIYFGDTNSGQGINNSNQNDNGENAQFINHFLALMTKIHKSDGIISHEERDHAVEVLKRFGINEKDRKFYYSELNKIKKNGLSFQYYLKQYKDSHTRNEDLDHGLIAVLLEAAAVDGIFHHKEEELIRIAVVELGITFKVFDKIKYNVFSNFEKIHIVSEYYKLFNCNPGESIQVLRKRHIELQKKFHPDNYSSKEIPDEMVKLAEEKTKEINIAFEILQKISGVKE